VGGNLHHSNAGHKDGITRELRAAFGVFTNFRHRADKLGLCFIQTFVKILVGENPSPPEDRKLQAFRHRGGMGKTSARTAGGASARFLLATSERLQCCRPVGVRLTVTISNIIGMAEFLRY
jgi:hypothetical protein